jgi:hypothetical protein
MMWHSLIQSAPFRSNFAVLTDEEASGKWLVPIPFDDPKQTWDTIVEAVARGELLAVKKSGPSLDRIVGHHIVCVYSTLSTQEKAREVLTVLRRIGVEGDLFYKSDRATAMGNDDKLWTSFDIEVGVIIKLDGTLAR